VQKLTPLRHLRGYRIGATDGDVGHVEDFYFDDRSWTLRHVVVRTGGWLFGRRVLVSPGSVSRVDHERRRLITNLTRRQVEDGPGDDQARPVFRQHQTAFAGYYGFPYAWHGSLAWGPEAYALGLPASTILAQATDGERGGETADPHLRSVHEVIGYGLGARDGELGHVEDLLVDERAWTIRAVVVHPRGWRPAAPVLVPPEWITHIAWGERVAHVDATRADVQHAPPPAA
jgi:sporulation protein YlmC with PRC-barrel domain